MKKVLLIMAAALLTMTQCRKENATPNMPADGTVKMTVTAGPGRTDINTTDGSITWSAGDKLYVSDGTNWLGSLDLVGEGGSAQGTFTGSIAGIDESETTCHFFYLGHDNGMEEPAAGTDDNVGISFAAQGGTLDGAMKYHLGHGTTAVTVTEGGYEGYVLMNTKIAMAHISFTTDGTQPYTGSLTMGGTGVSNEMTVSPGGAFTGSGTDGITIDNGDGTTGERYVTLIPTGTDRVDVAFTGDATGSMTFLAGIHENKFYGMKDAIAVTLEAAAAPKFSVGENTTVEFAPGNLYWDGSAFRFEPNQWDTKPAYSETEEGYGTWDASHVSHFFWSATESVAYAASYSDGSAASDDVFFTNSSSFQVDGEAGWRTLSKAEWEYLLNTSGSSGRTDASRFAKAKVEDVCGLLIFPDGYKGATSGDGIATLNATDAEYPDNSVPDVTWTSMETSGAVFLPAAGIRNGTDVFAVGSNGFYWSGTPNGDYAYDMNFDSSKVRVNSGNRANGYSVRLVR